MLNKNLLCAGVVFALGLSLGTAPAHAENIGVAQQLQPNERAKEVTHIFETLLGKWEGTYEFFDERAGKTVGGNGNLEFSRTPMPNVIMLDAKSERPVGPPVHALTVMVVQVDGSSLRQMVFREGDGRIQDKLITGYEYTDDDNWVIESIEVQQGLGLASVVEVNFALNDGSLEIIKRRRFEGGAAAEREFESRARFDRVE